MARSNEQPRALTRRLHAHAPAIMAVVVIVAAVVLVHGRYSPAMWDADDGFLLEFALRYSPLQYFFVPAYTHGLSPANVTPWLALAYDADLALFGLDPAAFYRVHVATIAAVALSAYLVMRLWLAPIDAAAAALVFIVGATTEFAARHLMVSHYVHGMAFALLSLLGYVHALRSRSRSRLALAGSAVAYAFALTCKELYVPLPLVMLFLPERDWRTRLRYCGAHLALLALYALWRRAVLGRFVGGYAGGSTYEDLLNSVSTFIHLPTTLLGNGAPMFAAAIVVLLLAATVALRRRVNVALALVVLAVILLPLVPLGVLGAIATPDRFFFVLWLAFAGALAWAASAVIASLPLRVVVYAVIGVAAYINLAAVRAANGPESDLSRIYAFVLNGDSRSALVIDKGQPYLNNQLNGLIFSYGMLAPGRGHARVVGRDELAEAVADDPSLFAWSPECRCVAPTTVDAQHAAVREYLPGGERASPAVDISYDARERTMHWTAGPYTDGTWTIRFEAAPGLWTVKYDSWRRSGGANVFWPDADQPFRFFVRFESAQGWAVRTPVLSFTPASEPHLSWAPPS